MKLLLTGLIFLFPLIAAECPDGTVSHNSMCYLFLSELSACDAARNACLQYNGNLVSIHDAFDNAFLSGLAVNSFQENPTNSFWIGAYQQTPANWSWADGSPFDFSDWDAGQPSNLYDCAAMNLLNGQWFSDFNDDKKPFMCEIKEGALPSLNCPNGWTPYFQTKSCYFVTQNHTNWEESENWCKLQGAHLASIHSDVENNFIKKLINFTSTSGYCDLENAAWIGLYTVTNQTTWQWSDNSSVNYYSWSLCNPDHGYFGADVAILQNTKVCPDCNGEHGNSHTWADALRDEKWKYSVCKKSSKTTF